MAGEDRDVTIQAGGDVGSAVATRIEIVSGSLGLLTRRLEFCKASLGKLGFRVSRYGRVSQAIQLMTSAAVDGRFPDSPGDLERLADAISLAFALAQVVDTLRDPVPPGLQLSIQASLGGSLGVVSASAHRRALSELHFASSLVAAGLPIGSPRPRPSKTPDFVATVDSFDFLVEVKRPSSEQAIPRKVDEAVKQCRKYADRPTTIVLDLTDLLPHSLSVEGLALAEEANRNAFNRLSKAALEYVNYKRAKDAKDVAGLFMYAEPVVWNRPAPDRLPTSILQYSFQVFPDCKMGIAHVSSRRFMQHSVRGLDLLAGKLNVLTREELIQFGT